ncbi:uncharacterized protein LOC125655613 isoform X2 [Ostrea edulis]|uniref:uncharacterized protein LOC125655613 isoform X2 n=1 Tax=Ostrea edulis TaxID=37623 RepID=UPI0024AF0D14|nr:uncharacterized protein LOC125655613 isoform X2 [Ostrea edulis]
MYNSSSGFCFSARQSLRQTAMDYAKQTTRAPKMFPQLLIIVTVILFNCIHPGDAAAPSSLTPNVTVQSAYSSVTELYIGSKVEFTLTVAFPTGTTEGVVVEILPSTNVTVMAVGAVTMSRGSNLDIDPNTKMVYHPTEDTKDSAFKIYTRGVYNFSDVYNSGTSGTDADNNLVIDYEAFVVSVDDVTDGATHWVSAGIEYNNSFNVWIGQVSYTMKTSNPAVSKTPEYNLTSHASATSLAKGELMTVLFEAWLPYPSPDIAAEAINLHSDSNNNDLQIVSLHVKSVGINIDGTTDAPQVNVEKMTSVGVLCNSSWTGSRRVRVVLPTTLTNKESRSTAVATSTADDKIEFEAVIWMTTDAVEGDVYPVGFGIEVDTAEVWVFYFNLTADPPSVSPTPSMSMAIGGVNSSACVGGVTDFSVNITTVESGLTTFSLTVEVLEKTASKPAGVMVAHMDVLESGENILCMETNLTKSSTTSNTAIENSASMYFNISNFGTRSHVGGNNTITVKVYLVPMPGYSFVGDTHKIKVGISGHTTANDESNEINIICENPPDTPVDYTFSFYHNCTRTCLTRGSVFEFILDITTERNKNPGRVNLELAVPTNDSESFFVLCGYEVTKIGSNLKCVNNDTINEATNSSVLPDGTYSKVDVVFPVMCNLGIVNDTEEDKVQVRLTVKIRNDTSVDSSRDEWFGLGSRYSTTQVWVGQYKLCIRAPDYYADLARVEGVAIDPADLIGAFPGVRGIEYSFDGVEFKDKSVIFTADGTNGSVYTIDKPFITKYVGMTNQPTQSCEKSCFVNHEMVVTKLDDYIEIFNDDSGDIKSKIPYALDGDNSTCFALPVQGDTPPLFWTRMNTSVILGINATQFDITLTGEGIACAKHSNNRVLQVSYPESSSVGKFHGNIQFCTLVVNDTSNPSFTACQFRCACPDPAHCEEVIIFLANEENGTTWKLCEISATNF